MKSIQLITLLFLLISAYSFGFENDPRAVCKQPGTNHLFVGGEFKTIMVVDETTGASVREIKTTFNVIDMRFSPSGKSLIVFGGGYIRYIDPMSGTEIKTIKATEVTFQENGPYILDVDWIFSGSIHVYSAEEGELVSTIQPDFKPLGAGFNADFSEIMVLGREQEISNEKSLIVQKITAQEGYNLYNKAYTSQQEDGKGSGFAVYEVPSFENKLNTFIPYATHSSFALSISGQGDHYTLGCWDMILKVDKTGKTTPVEVKDAEFAYAANALFGNQLLYIAGTNNGYIYNCMTGAVTLFDASIPGEFTYTADFSTEGKKVYMLDKAYTISILNDKGALINRINITRTSENGFGVYYTNGFAKKEARDKEAAIINGSLEKLGLPTIDLEQAIGDSNVLLGVFETMEEAERFQKEIDDNNLQYITNIAPYQP